MSTYVVGDLQGCLDPLLRLLDSISFDRDRDALWLTGDLVNRGPQSLDVLRYVRGLGKAAVVVLGNHDLHLLAVAQGRKPSRRDTLKPILNAPDRDELLGWLRTQPLMHSDESLGFHMLHAGLPPQWSVAEAAMHAAEVETVLRSGHSKELLAAMYSDEPAQWRENLEGIPRWRFIVNCFTRLRYCTAEGQLASEPKDAPAENTDARLMPWFAVPGRRSADASIVFGHWSTLGQVHWPEYGVYGMDTGCVWGGRLSALCLETGAIHSVPCPACQAPD